MHNDTTSGPESRRSRRTVIIIAALLILAGVAIHAPSLSWGFMYDDYIHQFALRGFTAGGDMRPWNLYAFGERPGPGDPLYEWGFLPWFTAPDWKIRFFRPVTSASIWLDFVLYGDWAPGYHITSLLLFAVFLGATFRLYRDLGAPAGAALWALAFAALEDNQFLPVGWIANRNTLLAALFTVATVLAVHRYRRTHGTGCLLACGVCFLLACGSKESGLIALPLAGLCVALDERQEKPSLIGRAGAAARSPCLWLLAALACAFVAFYVWQGYGANCLVYHAPWSHPLRYLAGLARTLPLAGVNLVFGISADALHSYPHMTKPVIAVGLPLLAGVAFVLLRTTGWTPLVAMGAGWCLIALLPEAGVQPMDRLFVTASIGTALVFGLFIHQAGPVRPLLAGRHYGRLAVAGVLLLTGLAGSVPGTFLRQRLFSNLARLDRQLIIDADIDRAIPGQRNVLLLNAPSGMIPIAILATWAVVHDDDRTHISFFQTGRRALDWYRDDGWTMTVSCHGSPIMTHRFEELFHAGRVPAMDEVLYDTALFEAVPVAVEPDGIRSVRLRFKMDLDDPACQFLAWQDGRLKRISPPAIGQTAHVPEATQLLPFAP